MRNPVPYRGRNKKPTFYRTPFRASGRHSAGKPRTPRLGKRSISVRFNENRIGLARSCPRPTYSISLGTILHLITNGAVEGWCTTFSIGFRVSVHVKDCTRAIGLSPKMPPEGCSAPKRQKRTPQRPLIHFEETKHYLSGGPCNSRGEFRGS